MSSIGRGSLESRFTFTFFFLDSRIDPITDRARSVSTTFNYFSQANLLTFVAPLHLLSLHWRSRAKRENSIEPISILSLFPARSLFSLIKPAQDDVVWVAIFCSALSVPAGSCVCSTNLFFFLLHSGAHPRVVADGGTVQRGQCHVPATVAGFIASLVHRRPFPHRRYQGRKKPSHVTFVGLGAHQGLFLCLFFYPFVRPFGRCRKVLSQLFAVLVLKRYP